MQLPDGYELKTAQQLLSKVNFDASQPVYFYIKTTSQRVLEYKLERIQFGFAGFTYQVTRCNGFRCFTDESFIKTWGKFPLLIKKH